MNSSSAWEGSDFRVLIVFLSPGYARARSRTYSVLEAIIRGDASRKYFVDYCHLPDKGDAKYFIKNKIPFIFGNISKRTVEEYDVVLFSVALYTEMQNLPALFYFSGIPLEHETRLKNPRYPLFILGGMGISSVEILCGGDGGGMLDLVLYGQAEGVLSPVLMLFQGCAERRTDCRDPVFKMFVVRKIVSGFKCAYYPAGYTYEVGGDTGIEVLSVTKKYSWLPDRVYSNHIQTPGELCVGDKKIFAPDNSNASSSDLAVSYGCTGYGACNFCFEGNICGKWLELPYERVESGVQNIKRMGAPNCVTPYSFNVMYVSYFRRLILCMLRNFSATSLRGFRIDSLAGGILPFLVAAGCRVFTLPVDGVGDRVRNEVLNKNLSFVQIKEAFKCLFLCGVSSIKVNMIWTGQEARGDVDDFLREVRDIAALRDLYCAKARVIFTFALLVIYNDTPLRWRGRALACRAVGGDVWGNFYFRLHEGIRAVGFQIRRKKSKHALAWEQIVLDYGRVLSPVIKEFCTDPDFLSYAQGISTPNFQKVKGAFVKHALPDPVNALEADRPFGFGFCSPVVQLVQGGVHKDWYGRVMVRGGQQRMCLRTESNLDPECFGCGMCKINEEVRAITERDLEFGHGVDVSLLEGARHENRPRSVARIVLIVHPELRELGKRTLSHFVASLFLQADPVIAEAFHSVKNYSPSFGVLDWFYGKMFFDLFLKNTVEITQEVVDKVGANLTFCAVSAVRTLGVRKRVKDAFALYVFHSKQNASRYKRGYSEYRGVLEEQVEKLREGRRGGREITLKKKDMGFYVEVCSSGSQGALLIPATLSPQLVLSNFISSRERKILEHTVFRCIDIFGTASGWDCVCGNPRYVSEMTGEVTVGCPLCMAKVLLRRLS